MAELPPSYDKVMTKKKKKKSSLSERLSMAEREYLLAQNLDKIIQELKKPAKVKSLQTLINNCVDSLELAKNDIHDILESHVRENGNIPFILVIHKGRMFKYIEHQHFGEFEATQEAKNFFTQLLELAKRLEVQPDQAKITCKILIERMSEYLPDLALSVIKDPYRFKIVIEWVKTPKRQSLISRFLNLFH